MTKKKVGFLAAVVSKNLGEAMRIFGASMRASRFEVPREVE
jgi:hypothetical protein